MWGELSSVVGPVGEGYKRGIPDLMDGHLLLQLRYSCLACIYMASCLLNVCRVVLGRDFCGASCLGASFLWGE